MFGCRALGVKPDIMAFAKGINSGYIPLGATMINERMAQAFESDDDSEFTPRAFMHGNTYSGHPLACAAAIANLRIVEQEDLPANAEEVGEYFLGCLKRVQFAIANIGDVRGMGLMIGIELVADKETKQTIRFERTLRGANLGALRRKGRADAQSRGHVHHLAAVDPEERTRRHDGGDVFDQAISAVE